MVTSEQIAAEIAALKDAKEILYRFPPERMVTIDFSQTFRTILSQRQMTDSALALVRALTLPSTRTPIPEAVVDAWLKRIDARLDDLGTQLAAMERRELVQKANGASHE